jgi:hypothetical protein
MTVIVTDRDGRMERWEGITEIIRYPRMGTVTLCRAPGPTKEDHRDEMKHAISYVRLEVV